METSSSKESESNQSKNLHWNVEMALFTLCANQQESLTAWKCQKFSEKRKLNDRKK